MPKNTVRQLRESMLMSKAELARKAGLSALTIDRVEKGNICRMDTKRKILLALGVKLSERDEVFTEPRETEHSQSSWEELVESSDHFVREEKENPQQGAVAIGRSFGPKTSSR